jgi:hypothetical protein
MIIVPLDNIKSLLKDISCHDLSPLVIRYVYHLFIGTTQANTKKLSFGLLVGLKNKEVKIYLINLMDLSILFITDKPYNVLGYFGFDQVIRLYITKNEKGVELEIVNPFLRRYAFNAPSYVLELTMTDNELQKVREVLPISYQED